MKKALGWLPDPLDFRDYKYESVMMVPLKFPFKADIRDKLTPIRDQGDLGSCTGFGTAAALEALDPPPKTLMSPLFIYYRARAMEGTVNYDAGAFIRDCIKSCVVKGACYESCWPYNISKFKVTPPGDCYWQAEQHQVFLYFRLNTLREMKICLSSGFGFIFGYSVYSSMFSDTTLRTGVIPMPRTSEDYEGGHCFTGDTKVDLLDGRSLSFKELCNEFKDKPFWVYSYDLKNKCIVPGIAHHPRLTGKNKKILKILLDNEREVKCTEDHLFLTRFNGYVKAKDLKKDMSLMPLYKTYDDRGYCLVKNISNKKYILVHRLIAKYMGLYKHGRNKQVIHHKDFNKLNNNPDNLINLTWEEHTSLHAKNTELLNAYAKSEKGRQRSRELMLYNWSNSDFKKKVLAITKINREKGRQKLKENRLGFQFWDRQKLADILTNRHKDKVFHEKVLGILHSAEIQLKATQQRNLEILTGENFRKQLRNTAIENIQAYNHKVKAGDISPTDAQIQARRANAKNITNVLTSEEKKIRALKTAFTRWGAHKYPSFETYLQDKICTNHKIIEITECGNEDVYDITVETYHNFALSAGVFVHNCVFGCGYDDNTELITIKNSWGKEVGDNGYFYIPYDYVKSRDLADDFWTVRKIEL